MRNKKTIALVFLALFLVAGIAMAQVCHFSDGISCRWSGQTVTWSNGSSKGQNAFHKITFNNGTTMGPRNIYVPVGGTSEKFDLNISNVEQCW